MMLMNTTGITARTGGDIRAFAPGTTSFGALLHGRFPAAG
jgi:hypothetical protein